MLQRFVLINICGEHGYQNDSRCLQWNLDPKGQEQPFPKTRWMCCFTNPSHHSICETQGGLDYRQAGPEFLAFGYAYDLFTAWGAGGEMFFDRPCALSVQALFQEIR